MRPLELFAAIDVGSNAIRFRLFELDADKGIREIRRNRYPVQLGRGVFSDGQLAPRDMARAAEAIALAVREANHAGTNQICAVATSAAREAANSQALIDQVQSASGISLRIISSDEEAQLAALGACRGQLPGAPSYVIDIGGGSTEIIALDANGIISWHRSLPLGAVRLLRGTSAEADGNASLVAEMVASVDREIAGGLAGADSADCMEGPAQPKDIAALPAPQAWALGGTPAALVDMLNVAGKALGARPEISADAVNFCLDIIKDLPPAELTNRYGVPPARAPLLLPGTVILARLMAALHLRHVLPSDAGVCEGLACRALKTSH